jgi:hypothetical protein
VFPSYNFALEDEEIEGVTHNVVVDERTNLLEALVNKGVAKNKAGIRIYNQKYYPVNYDEEQGTLYLKKVKFVLFRVPEEPVSLKLNSFTSSEPSIQPLKCKTASRKIPESSTSEWKLWPRI